MPGLLEINTTIGRGSTGRIVDAIGHTAQRAGWDVTVAHGPRLNGRTDLEHITVGSRLETMIHAGWHSRLRDAHGLGSLGSTRRLINTARLAIRPDLIHLHNIHGYYLNYPELFDYIRREQIPTLWTLHDCWAFTGHCAYYTASGCDGWLHGCAGCPNPGAYPASVTANKSSRNFELKRSIFNSISDLLTVVTPSQWLADQVEQSFWPPSKST